MTEASNETIHKRIFVETALCPLLKAINRKIITAKYFKLKSGEEIVDISYENGYKKTVSVTCDSLKEIAADVIKQI